MAHLSLTGVSDDGKRLILVDDKGTEHSLDITSGLRAALRGQGSRQLEISMDSVLRPRDIQARIRAGEPPEAVAVAAQTSVEKIMPFVGPVLAERAHVAQRAQRSMVRRRTGEPGTGRALGDAVESHLRAANIDPATVEWDAWRREDGRWSVRGAYDSGARAGTAEFTFDAPGNYVVVDNEDARWLVGEATTPAEPPARNDLESARQRRLGPVAPVSSVRPPARSSADELPLGVDAIELVSDHAPQTDEPADTPVEAFLDVGPASDDPQHREEAADAAADDRVGELRDPADPGDLGDTGAEQAAARRAAPKRKGRASVPSWDEIMFGGSDQP